MATKHKKIFFTFVYLKAFADDLGAKRS